MMRKACSRSIRRPLSLKKLTHKSTINDLLDTFPLCHQTDVRGNHAPALRGSHPGLALAPGTLTAHSMKLCIGRGKVAAISCDDDVHSLARQPLRRPTGSKGPNGFVAIQVFGCAIAQGVWTVVKQRVEHLHFVIHQGLLLLFKNSAHFSDHIWQIDIHSKPHFVSMCRAKLRKYFPNEKCGL